MSIERSLVWIDCDPGVDDAFAMVLAGYSDELEVLGVSTVAGNASIATTTRNGLKILWAAGMQNVPLVKGSAEWLLRDTKGPGAFYDEPEDNSTFKNPFDADSEVNLRFEKADLKPTDQNAVHFMYERITAHRPRRVTIFAIGPLTNVALLLKSYPEVQPAIERVVVMGGALGRGNVNPSAEANVWHDPHALQLLLHTRVPLVLVPIDLTQEVPFTEAARAHLLAAGSRFSAFMLRLVDVQQSNHPLDKPFMHDACAVAFAIDALHAAREPAYKSFFECKPMHIVVDTASKHSFGRTVCYECESGGTCVDGNEFEKHSANAMVALHIEPQPFWTLMLSTLSRADAVSPLNQSVSTVCKYDPK